MTEYERGFRAGVEAAAKVAHGQGREHDRAMLKFQAEGSTVDAEAASAAMAAFKVERAIRALTPDAQPRGEDE
jgi:hypothetical protein